MVSASSPDNTTNPLPGIFGLAEGFLGPGGFGEQFNLSAIDTA